MDQFVGCVGLVVTAIVGLSVVLPIVTAVRLGRAQAAIADLRAQIGNLESRISALASAPTASAPGPAPSAVREPEAPTVPVAPEAHWPAPPDVAVEATVSNPSSLASPAVTGPTSDPQTAVPGPVSAPTSAPPPAPEASTAPETAPAPVPVADTLETRLGGRGLLYAGVATLVFAIGFFVKYAFDNEWITETARVVLGAGFGVGMVVAGRRFVRQGYPLYGEVLAGGGFAAMYLALWAALNLYGLVSQPFAFAAMILVTAWAGVMADRLASQALAWVAVLGGFATPGLVAGTEDAQVVLLSYTAILSAASLLLAARHAWPLLEFGTYVLATITFGGWASVHYTASAFAPTQVFLLVFGGLFGWAYWRRCGQSDVRENPLPAVLLGSVLLLVHAGSVANLTDHAVPLLVYLIAVTLAGTFLSVRKDRAWIRLVTFVAVAPVLLDWADHHTARAWLVPGLVVVVAHYAMFLAACGERLSRATDPWPRAELALFHGNALALFAGTYIYVNAHWPYGTAYLAAALAVWHGLVAWRLRAVSTDAAVNSLAALFAMAGFAIGLQFDDWWALVGWAVEAAAVYWAGARTDRPWMRIAGGGLLALLVGRLFSMGFFDTPAGFAVWLNPRVGATLTIVAAMYAMSVTFRRVNGAASARAATEYAALLVGANTLTLLLLTVEINSYWHQRAVDDATASFALLASLSIAWGLYGTGLVMVGILRHYAPIRYLAIALLLLTVAKVFLVDLSELGGIYRIVGFMGLGVFLLVGAWLYQRFKDEILR